MGKLRLLNSELLILLSANYNIGEIATILEVSRKLVSKRINSLLNDKHFINTHKECDLWLAILGKIKGNYEEVIEIINREIIDVVIYKMFLLHKKGPEIKDWYITELIRKRKSVIKQDIPKEIIDLWRQNLIVKRLIKKRKKEIKQ